LAKPPRPSAGTNPSFSSQILAETKENGNDLK
jgi:hypothetical protein